MTKSEPSRNPSFLNVFYDFEPPPPKNKIKIAQPGGKAASPPACAFGAFIGLHDQKCIFKILDLAWVGTFGTFGYLTII